MSIASQIERIKNAKDSMAVAIESKGVSVPPTATIDSYAFYIQQIQQSSWEFYIDENEPSTSATDVFWYQIIP